MAVSQEDVIAAQSGDKDATMRVVQGMSRLLGSASSRIKTHVSRDDLLQAGTLGVLEALATFDPERGVPFVAYAQRTIKGAIHSCAGEGHSGPSIPDDARKTLIAAVSSGLTEQEISERLAQRGYHDYASLYSAIFGVSPLTGEEDCPSEDESNLSVNVLSVRQAMAELPDREREALTLCYWRQMNDGEIGTVMGIDRSRACRIRQRATAQMKERLK